MTTATKNSLQGLMNTTPKAYTSPTQTEEVEKKNIGNKYTNITVLEAKNHELDLSKWITKNIDFVEKTFNDNRIILFRGFKPLDTKSHFSDIAQKMSNSNLLDYTEPSTPRTQLEEKIYSSTEFPQEQYIAQHNEHSYSNHWPLKIFFYCETPSQQGGQTPICDSRSVYKLINPATIKKFENSGVLYVRNFSEEMDISWKDFFQTDDKEKVYEYCKQKNIQVEWKDNEQVRMQQLSQATLVHPELGDKVWFNQAHLFHYTNLNVEVYKLLLETYGEENLPRNAYYGDGSLIDNNTLKEIREAYKKTMVIFDWQKGDLIMLDNILYAHGRYPFTGERKILVAMAEEYSENVNTREKGVVVEQQFVSHSRKKTAEHFIEKLRVENSPALLKYKLAIANRIMATEHLEEGGISGHISLKVPDSSNLFWVNPFGLLSEEVTPDNLILVNDQGEVVEGSHSVNVAGFCIHATIHKMYPEINCIVHTHSPWGTVFSALDNFLEPIDQNCCMFFENHALYKEYNGPVNDVEDSMKLAKALNGKNAIILANHGTITCGESIETAVMYMVAIERAFRINSIAKQTGKFNIIDKEVACTTRDWIANPIGFKIEFDALMRKVERIYPELMEYKLKIN